MKKRKLVMVLACLLGMQGGLSVAYAAKPEKNTAAKSAVKEKAPVAVQEITLVSRLPSEKNQALQQVIDAFHAQQAAVRIKLLTQSTTGSVPEMWLLGDEEEAQFLKNPAQHKALQDVMTAAKLPLGKGGLPAVVSPADIDGKGKLEALPVAFATPVVFYNKALLQKAGLGAQLPPTWDDLQKVLDKLQDNGVACPYASVKTGWVHVENTTAWHNEPVEAQRGQLSVNNLLQVRHLARMASWYRARYLHVFDSATEAQGKFVSGECAVMTGPSDMLSGVDTKHLDIGIAKLPYWHEHLGAPQNTLADGASLWVASGKAPAVYQAVAQFVQYWLTPAAQQSWSKASGYLPLNSAGYPVTDAKASKGLPDNLRVALESLSHKPATSASRASARAHQFSFRHSLEVNLHELWNDKKAAKQVLDEVVQWSNVRSPLGR